MSQVEAYIGSEAQLKCTSSHPISKCQFVSSHNERFLMGNGQAYQDNRIKCLCAVNILYIYKKQFT